MRADQLSVGNAVVKWLTSSLLIVLGLAAIGCLWVYARSNMNNPDCGLLYERYVIVLPQKRTLSQVESLTSLHGVWTFKDTVPGGQGILTDDRLVFLDNNVPSPRLDSPEKLREKPCGWLPLDDNTILFKPRDGGDIRSNGRTYSIHLPRRAMQFMVSKWFLILVFLGACVTLSRRRRCLANNPFLRVVANPLFTLALLMAFLLAGDCALYVKPFRCYLGDDMSYMGYGHSDWLETIMRSKRPLLIMALFKIITLFSPFGQIVPYVLLLSTYASLFLLAAAMKYCRFPITAYFLPVAAATDYFAFTNGAYNYYFNAYLSEMPGYAALMTTAALTLYYARAVHKGARAKNVLFILLLLAVTVSYHIRITLLMLIVWTPLTVAGLLFVMSLPAFEWRKPARQLLLLGSAFLLLFLMYCGFRFLCFGEFSQVKRGAYVRSEALLFLTPEDIPALPMDLRDFAHTASRELTAKYPLDKIRSRKFPDCLESVATCRGPFKRFCYGIAPNADQDQVPRLVQILQQRHWRDIAVYRGYLMWSMLDLPSYRELWGYGLVPPFDIYRFGYENLRPAYFCLALYAGIGAPVAVVALMALFGKLKWRFAARELSRRGLLIGVLCLSYTLISLTFYAFAASRPLIRYIWFVYIMAPVLVWCLAGLLWGFAAPRALGLFTAKACGQAERVLKILLGLLMVLTVAAMSRYVLTSDYRFGEMLWVISAILGAMSVCLRWALSASRRCRLPTKNRTSGKTA